MAKLAKGSFRGDRSNIYAYVQSIIFQDKKPEFLKEIIEQRETKVGLTSVVENDDGESEEIDNPGICREPEGRDLDIRIPKSVQGVDLTICKLMLTTVRGQDGKYRGRNYANIGLILGMTENAVKKRMEQLRDRLKKEKKEREAGRKEQQRIEEQAEAERRNSVSIGLARIRGVKR